MQILYATDGSPGALAAAELLNALVLSSDDRIMILAVVPGGGAEDGQATVAAARAALSHSPAGIEADIRAGHPADEILRAAEGHPTDLIAVGASGRSALARFFIGSEAERVARHAACPVVVARPLRGGLHDVVAGVDGSAAAARAITWLHALPLPEEAEIRLITVLPRIEDLTRTSPLLPLPLLGREDAEAFIERESAEARAGLEERAAAFAAAGRRAVTEIRRGDPAGELLAAAADEGADLLVVGSQGHSAVERFLVGSVSERLLRHAPCSVLIVR